MHRASLRKKRSLNCFSPTLKGESSYSKTILPCCKWTDEKQGARQRGMGTNTFRLRQCEREARIWRVAFPSSKLPKSVLSKVAKRKNYQQLNLVEFTRHSPQAGEPCTAVAHGGNPQDRAASPDGDAMRTPRRWLLKLLTGEPKCRNYKLNR